jgi:kinesin family protein 2/24
MMQQSETPKIRVVIRKRPLSKLELGANQNNIIDVTSKQTLIVREEKLKLDLTKYIEQTDFVFDTVFDEDRTNIDVYKEAVRPLVQAVAVAVQAPLAPLLVAVAVQVVQQHL